MRRLAIGFAAVVAAIGGGLMLFAGHWDHHRHGLVVGGVEDSAKWVDPAGNMALARRAGFQVIVLSSVWRRPLTAPPPGERAALGRAVHAADADGISAIVAVYWFAADTPRSQRDRAEVAAYAASILRSFPELRYISIGNEPNSSVFWMPQFGPGGADVAASGYLRVLETAYSVLHRDDPGIAVIGGSLAARGGDRPHSRRPSHSPTRFVEDLGAALRAGGGGRLPLDLFSIHPYPANSSIPPTHRDPRSRAIGIADYAKLVRLLDGAFGRAPPIVYGEYGIETVIPRSELDLYSGKRAASIRPVSEGRQAEDYVEALRLAACQPLVRMLIFFHVTDESALTGLQTGLFYPNGRPKSSLAEVAASAQAAEKGQVPCRR